MGHDSRDVIQTSRVGGVQEAASSQGLWTSLSLVRSDGDVDWKNYSSSSSGGALGDGGDGGGVIPSRSQAEELMRQHGSFISPNEGSKVEWRF